MARKKQVNLTLFPEAFTATKKLTDEQFGRLMRAAYAYRMNGEEYDGDDMVVAMAFGFVASQIDRYTELGEKNSVCVKKRWDKTEETENTKSDSVENGDTNAYGIIRNSTESYECIRNDTKSDSVENEYTPNHTKPDQTIPLPNQSNNHIPTAVEDIGAPAAETKVPTPSDDKREKRIRFLETKLKLYKSHALADQEDYRQTLAEWRQLKGEG